MIALTDREQIQLRIHNQMIPRIIRRKDDVDVLGVPGLCRHLVNCIGSFDYDFESVKIPFAFRISIVENRSGQFVLDPKKLPDFIAHNCSSKTNIISIDYSGRFIQVEKAYFDSHIAAAEYSETHKDFLFFIYGRQIFVIINGVNIDFVPNASSYSLSYGLRGTELHIDEWEKILTKYELQLNSQKRFHYWATPKTAMKLIDAPEKMFRKDLAKYFEEHTTGCIIDEEAYNDNGEDRVDVRAVTKTTDAVYYFELKCLGVCVGGKKYDDDHAHEGLAQTNTYVLNDGKSVLGVLVVFDGRKSKTTLTWPTELKKRLDTKVHFPPKQIKLEIESASAGAKALIRAIKKGEI